MKRIVIVFIIFAFFVSGEVFACSGVFVNKGGKCFVGRTMDWRTGHTNVVVNERGIAKMAEFLQDRSAPAKWTSKYGSITFNLDVDLKWYIKLLAWISRINTSAAPSCWRITTRCRRFRNWPTWSATAWNWPARRASFRAR